MPRFLRIFNHMIYVPSLSSASVETSCWGGLSLCLNFHSQKTEKIYFKNWDECQATLKKVKDAMGEVDGALAAIPLVEEPQRAAPSLPSLLALPQEPMPGELVQPVTLVVADDLAQQPGGE